jgi:hypothetical protein
LSKTYRNSKTGATRKVHGTLGYPWEIVDTTAPASPVKPAPVKIKPATPRPAAAEYVSRDEPAARDE